MRRWRGTFLIFLLSGGIAPPILAEHLPVRLYTVADGLPSGRINTLYADSLLTLVGTEGTCDSG